MGSLGNLGNLGNLGGLNINWPDLETEWPPPLPDPVKILKTTIENGAKSVATDEVIIALESFIQEVNKLGQEIISEQAQQYIAELEKIKEEYDKLKDTLDIQKIKRDILTKAEEFCEAYLKEKVSLPKDFPIKIFPKVHLDFHITWITIEVALYVMKQEDNEKNYRKLYLVAATFRLGQNFNEPLQAPDFVVEPNPDFVQNEIDKIKKEIENQKQIIVTQMIRSVMSDYVPPLRLLKDYLPIF